MKKALLPLCLLCSFSASALQNIDPIDVAARTTWDDNTTTVAHAVEWLLEPTGYEIQTEFPAPAATASLLKQPIPPSMKLHRTMPIIDALQLLVGLDNTVIIDRKHQLIAFEKGVLNR